MKRKLLTLAVAAVLSLLASGGAITRVGLDGSLEVVMEGSSFPTAIAFARSGDAYVTVNGFGAPSSGQVVKHAGLGAP